MIGSPVAVDASVAAKWVVTAEELAGNAQALLRDCVESGLPPITPPHFIGEVANAIYQRWRSQDPAKHLTDDEAEEALRRFMQIHIQSLMPSDLYQHAFDFARTHRLPSIYDSLYVVLAQLMNIELWTADRRLLDAVGTSAPWVRFIGHYPL